MCYEYLYLEHLKYRKSLGGRRSAPDPAAGAHSALINPQLVGRGWLPPPPTIPPLLSALQALGCGHSGLAELLSRNEEIKIWSPCAELLPRMMHDIVVVVICQILRAFHDPSCLYVIHHHVSGVTRVGVGFPTFDFSIPGHRRTIDGPKAPNEAQSAEGDLRGAPYPIPSMGVREQCPHKIFEISVAKSRILMHFAHFCV